MTLDKKILIIIGTVLICAVISVIFFFSRKDVVVVQNPLLVQERPMVTYTEGQVLFRLNSTQDWEILETGQKLVQGTTLKTGPDGRIDIKLSRESLLRMAENTITDIDRVTIKRIEINHREGRLYAKFHKIFKDQSFTVQTPNTTAGIRGTELVFDVTSDGTTVYALSGITEVKNRKKGEPILLSYNSFTRVKDENSPTSPVKIDSREEKQLRDELNGIHEKEVLHISYQILFEPNSEKMLDSSMEELDNLRSLLEENRMKIEIGGHTAEVGSHGAMYSLSLKRAEVIRQQLVDRGIKARRLSVAGYGATKPVANNGTEKGRALNRRVEFVVVDK